MRTSRWVLGLYAVIIFFGLLAALPNLFTKEQQANFPALLPKHGVSLGLDLSGGSHLVLEVDAKALKADRLRALQDTVRSTLRDARIPIKSVRSDADAVTATLANDGDRDKARPLLEALAIPLTGSSSFGSTTKDQIGRAHV